MKTNKKQGILYSLTVFFMALLMVAGAASYTMAETLDKNPKIDVMTRNLYLGADIFKVVEAAQENPDTIPWVVAEIYNTMLFTNFWARAEAIADEIAKHKPIVIGLQEVSTFYKQTPGDFMEGNPVPADELVIDFYEVLNAALLARGMEYDAFTITNATVELPMADEASGTGLSDVRMVDHDMILVSSEYESELVLADNYLNNLEMSLGGTDVAFTRGYLVVDVMVQEEVFRFVNTHLEVRGETDSVFRLVQSAQMLELIDTLAALSQFNENPVVMIGDFNSSPEDVPGMAYHPLLAKYMEYVPPYMQAVYAGYQDAWLLQKNYSGEGYTSGFDEKISDPTAELTSRIDLIFTDPGDNYFINKAKCEITGNEVSDMIPNPASPDTLKLWPSDHAGVVAEIKYFK